ncbi:MAG TPA: DegT/DnrJ/EryC1/StrS family aminotransferase [Niallia sp.]|nr:DegT/DnrJ/EryC1/StrS family aminotransferase [Niallia sp.]
MSKRIYLSSPHMGGSEMKYIQEAFNSNWIAPLGPNVNAFEQEICDYTNSQFALAISSGTAGIHLALKYLGVGAGDYVFCSSLTFSASCNPILYEHAIPIFIDSEPNSWNMSSVALEKAFKWAEKQNKLPKAVIVVDLYGQTADWDSLLPICKRYGVPVIEDAAEALGATYKGKYCGTFGDIGVFSFNGNKIITTSGGGMVVSENKQAIDKMLFWSTQAREQVLHYEHKELGYNYRMSNVCAGIGRGQLEFLKERIAKKGAIFNKYKEDLNGLPIKMMPIINEGKSNFWLSVLTINEDCSATPSDIIGDLNGKNIEARPVWKPMHLQPFYKEYKFFSHIENGSVSGDLFNRGVCLPSDTKMIDDEIEIVIDSLKTSFTINSRNILTI